MHKLGVFGVLYAVVAIAAATPALSNRVITFDDKTPAIGVPYETTNDPYVRDGVTVSALGGAIYGGTLFNQDTAGGTSFVPLTTGAKTTVLFTNPQNVISISLSDAFNSGICAVLPAEYCAVTATVSYAAGGSAATIFNLAGTPTVFNFGNLGTGASAFTLVGDDGIGYSLDNIVISGPSVPEPASWAMMIAGFSVVGSAMRRRKITAAIAR